MPNLPLGGKKSHIATQLLFFIFLQTISTQETHIATQCQQLVFVCYRIAYALVFHPHPLIYDFESSIRLFRAAQAITACGALFSISWGLGVWRAGGGGGHDDGGSGRGIGREQRERYGRPGQLNRARRVKWVWFCPCLGSTRAAHD